MSEKRLRDYARSYLYSVKAFYLGSEAMGELREGENGSDAVQKPLKRTILKSKETREEVTLSITTDTVIISPLNSRSSIAGNKLVLPIELLAYCGALRQQPIEKVSEKGREFETLDKAVSSNPNDPPLFVTIFRSLEHEGTLNCHSFVISKDDEAMELVKLIMEIYYNLAQLNEAEELSQKKLQELKLSENSSEKIVESSYNDLLEIYNKQPVDEKVQVRQTSSESDANLKILLDESLRKKLDLENYEIVNKEQLLNDKYINVPLNEDDDPIVIKKPNEEKVVYNQNVFIRWLQPPTPPPPAPIISKNHFFDALLSRDGIFRKKFFMKIS